MSLDPEPFKKKALDCFIPPLQGQDEDSAWEELKHLSDIYRHNLDRDQGKQPFLVTFNYWIQWPDGSNEEVIDPPPPRRRGKGRPPKPPAEARLVHDLRNLLIDLGCRHGACHQDRNRYHSALQDLATVVHGMAGEPSLGGSRDHNVDMANANLETSSRKCVTQWWLNLDYGPGAHPRSTTLKEGRLWEAIYGPILGERSSRSATWPWEEGPEWPEEEGNDR